MLHIENVVMLTKDDAGLDKLLCRIYPGHINKIFKRREPIIIKGTDGKKIIRYAVGGAGIAGINSKTIGIDYDGLESLGIGYNGGKVSLVVRKATGFEIIRCFLNHPEIQTRISIRLGFLGAFLGFLGLFISILSFL